ncbi:MAG: PEP-CTERM sorting domain-containing protein [Phycisphaerales bacterium]|nr:PEP-CTERM sorting domain-containing protein [Phycisphaerales bacterium]
MKVSRLISDLDQHLGKCAMLAAAGVGTGMMAAPQADAAVVDSGIVNINIPSTTAGVYLNMITGATGTSSFTGYDVNLWSSSALNVFSSTGATAPTMYVTSGTASQYDNLAVGALIGPGSTFSNIGTGTINPATPLNLNSDMNCIGFKFLADDGNTHYGWVQVSLAGTAAAQPRSIVRYAYESEPNVGLAACVVPEPASLSMLALGAFGVLRRRR